MRIQTFSIITGTRACNAACPFCVSKMTPKSCPDQKINWRNFNKACRLAQLSGVTTVMLTGKGEPTLYPYQIEEYLRKLKPYDFPFIELQTNGIALTKMSTRLSSAPGTIGSQPDIHKVTSVHEGQPVQWYDLGLNTIAISVVHWEREMNKAVYTPNGEHFDLPALIQKLHDIGFSVRLSCIMVKGFIDTPLLVKAMIYFAKEHKVEQLTFTPVNKPANKEFKGGVEGLTDDRVTEIRDYLDGAGTRLLELPHGAIVYDVIGQNACLSNCLKLDPNTTELRNLIFHQDGRLRWDWQYEGAIIL